MKNLSLTFCLVITALASPVWSETLDNLVFRYEKFFPKFSDEPFNGKIEGLIQGTLKNGLWDGEYLEFQDDGQLKIKVIYKDGKIESPTKTYIETDYTQGLWTEYNLVMREGVLFSQFSNKPFSGEISGKIQATIRDGLWSGQYLQFWENGQLRVKRFYTKNTAIGPYEVLSQNGVLQDKGFFKDGIPEGLRETYHSNGKLASKSLFKDGIEDGIFETYYETGQFKSKSFFKDGVINGVVETYHLNGQFKSRVRTH